ncbi:hypothetical protein L9F63_001931 [Diploptera punctata]|uniref:N-acylneuraminate-9-phosphatase n=1 Tax=Diploptera punctata TaxID=6984 RepID=A0AAD8A360_DIPPU|nr:hypothetical protein L9F63_001931 [Diploptera punctata]
MWLSNQSAQHKTTQLSSILQTKYGIPGDVATLTTHTFLHNFRLCPDNSEVDLDVWRQLLWKQALGKQHATIAGDVYAEWLKLRYHYLTISSEVSSFLWNLRKHYSLCLITNGPSRSQWEKIERLNLRPYFDCILVSGDLPWEKPDKNIFLKACNYLGVQPSKCIMVGDKLETDIQGGVDACLGATVWLASSQYPGHLEPRPDFIINSITDLIKLFPFRTSLPDIEDHSSNASDGS